VVFAFRSNPNVAQKALDKHNATQFIMGCIMSLKRCFSENGKELTIYLDGKFDFTKVNLLRLAYLESNEGVSSIVINLQKTEWMDSSALGALVNMRKSLGHSVKSFKISDCRPEVLKILKIAHFGQLFKIS
jgi:anti-anti-sigma factor